MPSLSWLTGRIVLDDFAQDLAPEDVRNVTDIPSLQVSIAHEFVHFLQVVTSVAGIRLLADLVDFGIRGALILSGTIPTDAKSVSGYRKIQPLLGRLATSSWQAHEGIIARRNETMDELDVMFSPDTYAYSGTRGPWEVARQIIEHKTFVEPMWGFVVASSSGPRFRPFTIGFLAEAMARRSDRWLARQVAPSHTWGSGQIETEFYSGLLSLLARPQYEALSNHNLEELTVVLSTLALGTPRPDEALVLMLRRLETDIPGGPITGNVADELRRLLVSRHLFHADHYNEAITDVIWGAAQIMDRAEYYEVHRRLVQVHEAANRVLQNPSYFVEPNLSWGTVEQWMKLFPPPPVLLSQNVFAEQIGNCMCEPFATTFLSEVERTLLREPANSQLDPTRACYDYHCHLSELER